MLLFIDFDERNIIRRIDLDDFRVDHLRLPVFLSNLATSKAEPIVYCLSRVSGVIYRVYIDVSLLEEIDHIKIESTTVRTGETKNHNFSMIETGPDGLVVAVGDIALDSSTHSNIIVVLDANLKEIARREVLCDGRGTPGLSLASWFEKALICKMKGKTYIALVVLQKFDFIMMELNTSKLDLTTQ